MAMIDASQLKEKQPYVLDKYKVLAEVAEESPRAAELLTEYGLHCANCFANQFDTLEQGAQLHEMSDKDIDQMVDEINEELEREVKEKL